MKSILVTGASSGIGRATALHLDELGWRVFAGVRKEADAEALRAAGSERLTPLMLDVTDEAAIAAAATAADEALGSAPLDALVNNAGLAISGPLEFLPIEEFRAQIEVNLIAQVAVTQAMLPMLRRSKGRIVFISSIGGRIATPFGGPYHASKFGIEAIGDSLRQELRPWGMEVILVEPGSIATNIWAAGDAKASEIFDGFEPEARELYEESVRAMQKASAATGERGIEPIEAARVIAKALTARRPKTRYLVGRDAQVGARVRKIVPDRVFDRIVARQAKLP